LQTGERGVHPKGLMGLRYTSLSLSQTLSCLAVDRESDDDRAQ
jgi:hypothetical protein